MSMEESAAQAAAQPSRPPAVARANDSARIRPNTWKLSNPTAFRMAISLTRSRMAMLMVPPVTSTSVKTTTMEIEPMSSLTLPSMETKPS